VGERRVAIGGRVLADVTARTPKVVDDELARTVARDLGRLYGLLRRELGAVRLDRDQVGVRLRVL
jgi:hypothetical protein